MRFENWDVLLFPQVSGTPIQEFRTECFGVVTRTSNNSHLPRTNANYLAQQSVCLQLSTRTSLRWLAVLPSRSRCTRGASQSCRHPRPSEVTKSFWPCTLPSMAKPLRKQSASETIHHHKFTDRHLCSIQRINPDGNFPHQVFNSPVSRTVFPPFHRATMRSQLQLHVADNVGRITVGLSEGYFYVADGRPHFSPVKDVVTFKWIHAPQSK
jgi:hypothetical protein